MEEATARHDIGARKYWQINLENSIISGDRLTDIIAGA